MPLDTGHEHLIRTALDRARSVTVIVVARRDHAILGAERARWIEEAFPDETVVVLDQDEVGLADDDTAGSARETIRAIGRAPDVALTSERYGGAWAAAMAQGVHPTSRRDRHALRRGGDARTADAAGDGRGRRTARRGTGAGRVGERTMNSVQTPGVDMVFVLSTAIEAIGYDQRRRELYVRFRETGTYVYSDVPEAVYAGFLQADSKGSYANDLVKPYYSWREL
jgi:hypothetical protein